MLPTRHVNSDAGNKSALEFSLTLQKDSLLPTTLLCYLNWNIVGFCIEIKVHDDSRWKSNGRQLRLYQNQGLV